MLHDRGYMGRGGGPASDPHSGMRCLFGLVIANVVMFLLAGDDSPLRDLLELSPSLCVSDYMLWQPLTALFLHGDFFHIFFNMFGLYIFGSLAAPILGGRRFLTLFLVAGLCGNTAWLLSNLGGIHPLIGASGAVMGVTMAAAMVAPDVEMMLLFAPFPIKLKTLAVVFVLIDLVSEMLSPMLMTHIAYVAHIGGFFGGYLYMRLMQPQLVEWDFLRSIFGRGRPAGWRIVTPPPPPENDSSGRVTQAELDRILDKISSTGINSLSEVEMETLRRAREQMKGSY